MPVASLHTWSADDGRSVAMLYFWCPGCDQPHAVEVVGGGGAVWQWDGNLEAPTVQPSILVHNRQNCHSFVTAGRWHFLGDSLHPLAGQTVDMVDLPDWLTR